MKLKNILISLCILIFMTTQCISDCRVSRRIVSHSRNVRNFNNNLLFNNNFALIPIRDFLYTYNTGYLDYQELQRLKAKVDQLEQSVKNDDINSDSNSNSSNVGSVNEAAYLILKNNCQKCHNENTHSGNFQMFTGENFRDGLNWDRINTVISSGKMPKGGSINEIDQGIIAKFVERVGGL